MHGFNQLATFKQRAKAAVWRRAEHPGPADLEPALPAAPQQQQDQQHPEQFLSKVLLPRTLQTQTGHGESNDAQNLRRNIDASARSPAAALKLKAIVSIRKPYTEAPLRFADPLAASIRNRTLTAALSIFKNRKSSRVLRLSDVPNLPAPVGQPVQPTRGQRCFGDRGLKTARQGGYNANGSSPQPLGAGARPEAVDSGSVPKSLSLGQQPCQRPQQRSLLAAVPPDKTEALTRSTAPDAYRPISNTRANSDGSHRAWSRSGLPPQRPLTAGQVDDERQPLDAADAAGEKVAVDDAVRSASVTAVPLAAADAALEPVLRFGDDLEIRECMKLVRSRVASMVEADLGVRLRAPEQPAIVRQAGGGPTVNTSGTGDIAKERSAAETSMVPTVQESEHAAPGQEKHARRGQQQSRALADRDTVEGATCVQDGGGGAARHNGQSWTFKHARASRRGAGCELDTDLLIQISSQQTAEDQGIQREQIPNGGRGGPPSHRDSSGALGPMTAPSRGCEQGWEHSQTAQTSDKWKHELTGNAVPGLSASFLCMDDEQPDHPALRKRARGDRVAAAIRIRREPWGRPAEDADGHNAQWQPSAAAEDTSVGLAASMRSTSASTDECNDEFPGDSGEALQWRSTGQPCPPHRGAPCSGSGPRAALLPHKHFGGTANAGGGVVPPFYPDAVWQTSHEERHPPQPGLEQRWKLSAGMLPPSSGGAEPSGSQQGDQRHHYSCHPSRAAAVIASEDIAISESPAKVALGRSFSDNLWLGGCDDEDGFDMQHDDGLPVPLLKRQRRQGLELHSSSDAHGGGQRSAGGRRGLTRERRTRPAVCSTSTEQMYWEGEVRYDGKLKEGLREATGTADAVHPGLRPWLVGDERPHVSFGNAKDWPPHDFKDYQRDELRMRQQLHGGWDVDEASLAGGGRDTRGSNTAVMLRATDLASGGGASARVPSRLRWLNEGHEEHLVGFGAFKVAGLSQGDGQDGNAALTHFTWQQVGPGGGIGVADDQLEEADVRFEENVEELFQFPERQVLVGQLQGHRYPQQTQEHEPQHGLSFVHKLDAGTSWFDGGKGSDLVGDA